MKQSVLKQVSVAYAKIQKAYIKGEIDYPRVGHDYMPLNSLRFYEYPHKPLVQFDEYSAPLREEEYPLIKETLPLFFTHFNISTPATIVKNIEFIDKFIDDDLEIKERFREEVREKLPIIIEMIEEECEKLLVGEINAGHIPKEFSNALEGEELERKMNFLAKDGDIWNDFDMVIRPYTVSLSPNILTSSELKEDEEENANVVELPKAFKISSSPTRNYSVCENDMVAVQSLDTAIRFDNIARGMTTQKEIIRETIKKMEEVLDDDSLMMDIEGNR